MTKRISICLILIIVCILTLASCGDKEFTITFESNGGTEIESITTNGKDIVSAPIMPTKDGHVFDGWFLDETFSEDAQSLFGAVFSDSITLYAKWTPKEYNCIFYDDDGQTVLQSSVLEYNTAIVAPNNPTKASTKQYSYAFTSWDKKIPVRITSDITFTAIYAETTRKYTYTFLDEDGETVISSKEVDYGTAIIVPDEPTKESTQETKYFFTGWDKIVPVTITEDITFIAEFDSGIQRYSYTFYDYDGTVISSKAIDYGTAIPVPDDQVRESTEEFNYEFLGWDKEIPASITANIEFTAQYTPILRTYTYTFFEEDETTIVLTKTVIFGTVIILPEVAPIKASTQEYDYEFMHWDKTIPYEITNDIQFFPVYQAYKRFYTYTYYNEDGTTIFFSDTKKYGEQATKVQQPTKPDTVQYAYSFIGWGKEVPALITSDMVFTAVFSETLQQYLVTYEETDMPATTLNFGDTIERPAQDPTRADHIFYGWYTSLSFQTEYIFGDRIAGNVKIYARFGRLDFIEAKDGSGYFVYSRYTYQGNNVVVPSTYRGRQVVGIHDAFASTPIESVVLPEGLITINENAFSSCESLTSVTLPSTLQTIGRGAFSGAKSLTEIYLPNGLLSIGDNAFNLSGLTKISIPSSVNSIGNYAFRMCSALRDATIANGVQTLGNSAFYQTGLENVIVPGSIKEVGEMAFFACHSLKTIVFETGVKIIGNTSVNQCEELIQVTLPDGLLSIGENAFLGTTKLTNIDIPLTVTEILDGAFSVSGITKITIPGGVKTISDSLFSHCENLVDVTILEGVETIESYAFYNCGVKTLILPESIKTIEEMAFRFCDFTALVIGSGLTTLNNNICSSQSKITIKNTTPPILAENAAYYNLYVPSASLQAYKTAESWSALERYIKKMPEVSFETNCTTSLDSIEIPYGISVGEIEELIKAHHNFIGWYIDSELTTEFDLNTEITKDTTLYAKWTEFLGTDGLSYELTNGDTEYAITRYTGTSKSIYIPSQYQGLPLTSIAPSAFYGTTITDVFMANNIKTIGANCFDTCRSLESITFSTSLETIGDDAFRSCGLTSLLLPASVTTISSNAFINCVQIAGSILIPKNVTTIGSCAFRNVYASITFEENSLLTTLEYSVFENFKGNLTNLPNNLQVIQGSAFNQASNIISLVIPSSVTTIGSYAFNNSVKQVTFATGSQLETLDSNAFQNYKGMTITLPKSLLNIGVEAFKGFSGAILFEENSAMTSIGEQAFKGYLGAAIALPDNIISIGTDAFISCTNLILVNFGSKIETIGAFAFGGCDKLTDIVLPASVIALKRSSFYGVTSDISFATGSAITTIDQSAFNGYKGENIILPKTITTISAYAFDGCDMLTNLVIPESVNSIGESAFVGVNFPIIFEKDSQLATVKAKAFRGYKGSIITLPKAVTSIENLAFTECTNLESLIIKSIIPPNVPNSVAIFDIDSDINIYVYSESLESYKTDSYFDSYAEKIFTLCRVEFYLTEDSSIKLEILEGDIVLMPDTQEMEGFTFDGWYTDYTYTTLYDFLAPILSDTTIYAKWVAA